MSARIKLLICVFAYYQATACILAAWTQYIETYVVIQAFMLNQRKKKSEHKKPLLYMDRQLGKHGRKRRKIRRLWGLQYEELTINGVSTFLLYICKIMVKINENSLCHLLDLTFVENIAPCPMHKKSRILCWKHWVFSLCSLKYSENWSLWFRVSRMTKNSCIPTLSCNSSKNTLIQKKTPYKILTDT